MADHKELFSHFACVLPVQDVQKSLNFYHGKLGFEITFNWNDPEDHAVLKGGEVIVILNKL